MLSRRDFIHDSFCIRSQKWFVLPCTWMNISSILIQSCTNNFKIKLTRYEHTCFLNQGQTVCFCYIASDKSFFLVSPPLVVFCNVKDMFKVLRYHKHVCYKTRSNEMIFLWYLLLNIDKHSSKLKLRNTINLLSRRKNQSLKYRYSLKILRWILT